jgi:hypothetical protein
MKKTAPATLAAQPHPITAGDLAAIDGGAPVARSNHYNGSRENNRNNDIRASSEWRNKPENQPSAGIHTAEGTPIQTPKFDASFLKKDEYRTDAIDWRTGQFR